MHHVILGYGYSGFHLAAYLLNQQQSVSAFSRHLDEAMRLPGLQHQQHDLLKLDLTLPADTILYYLIPPSFTGRHDSFLHQFLSTGKIKPTKVVYFSSSAVYGDHQGDWVDEASECRLVHERQFRRRDAEEQWRTFCEQKAIDCLILRVAGIYGPHRLPTEAAANRTPVIDPEKAPCMNHIYVKDLAAIAGSLALTPNAKGIYNIADGKPTPMGTLQQRVSRALHLPAAPTQSFEQSWQEASDMKKEFMAASKRLRITALQTTLNTALHLTPLTTAINESLANEGKLS